MGRKARLKGARKEETQEEQVATESARSRRKVLLAGIPIVTLALVALFWFVVKSRFGVGMSALVGAIAWIAALAQSIGEDVKPKDRDGASRIDFGGKR
ncbi:MAG: hypothetical protein AMXMBFR64_31410 [Myxococcales bacterium]